MAISSCHSRESGNPRFSLAAATLSRRSFNEGGLGRRSLVPQSSILIYIAFSPFPRYNYSLSLRGNMEIKNSKGNLTKCLDLEYYASKYKQY